MRWLAALALVCAASPARADDKTGAEPTDRTRAYHAALTAAMGAAYLTLNYGINSDLAPTACRWCDPDAFDHAVRDGLVWHDTSAANSLSAATGFVAAPLAAVGLVAIAGGHRGWRRHYDDVVPVVESALVASLVDYGVKIAVARQRPYAHFATPGTLAPSDDDNASFFSGHTTLTFSLAVSAGTIASDRGYALAPAIWATGLTLATTTGYLRIAADKHYATDVLVGAAFGTLVGYAWPRLVHPWIHGGRVELVPTGTGLAAVGTF